jgi:hypothetical protein
VPQSTRDPEETAPAPPAPPEAVSGEERMRRGYARSEARNQEIRAGLAPIAPGERPGPFKAAAVLLAVLALGNLILFAAGWEVSGDEVSPAYAIGFSLVMLVAALGVWRMSYLAVLAMQALLGISIAIAGLGLLVASNLAAAAICLVVIGGAGTLFWKLIRPMARLQIPAGEPAGTGP